MKAFHLMQSFLQMIRFCFLLCMTFKLLLILVFFMVFLCIQGVEKGCIGNKWVNKDLERISQWATPWKMIFNPDTTKQAQEVIFSCKFKNRFILHYCLIIQMLLGHLPKIT